MTTTTKYDDWSTEELGNWFSDYYKDVWGSRPRFVSFDDRDGIIQELTRLDAYMDSMRQTVEGRNSLRDNGWSITSPSAEEDGWTDPYADMDYIEQYHNIMNSPVDVEPSLDEPTANSPAPPLDLDDIPF